MSDKNNVDLTRHRRGSHARLKGMPPSRGTYFDQAGAHYLLVKEAGLGSPCKPSCPFKGKCGDLLTRNDMYACHERSFGITTFNEETKAWHTTMTTAQTQEAWRSVMISFVRYDANDKASFSFSAGSRRTCGEFARVAYGISQYKWNCNLAQLRKGKGVLEAHSTIHAWDAAARTALAAERTSSRSEAVAWWMVMFDMWDSVPNEYVLVHPRIVWDRLYVSS
eukprot:6213782-Pleurochrysis_carterae.AAC.2